MSNNTVVRARINSDVKTEAMEVLEAMGLTISDAIRLLLLRVAEEKQLPFIVKVPNAATAKALKRVFDGVQKLTSSRSVLWLRYSNQLLSVTAMTRFTDIRFLSKQVYLLGKAQKNKFPKSPCQTETVR